MTLAADDIERIVDAGIRVLSRPPHEHGSHRIGTI